MNIVANIVLIAIPNTTAAPKDIRLAAPAPVAKSKGMTPNTKANEVIRIGRKRDTAESSIASGGIPYRITFLSEIPGELYDQDTILGGQGDQ